MTTKRRIGAAVVLVVLGLVPALTALASRAGAASLPNFVYVNENPPSNATGSSPDTTPNYVDVYSVFAGSETLLEHLATGGTGGDQSFIVSPRADLTMAHTSSTLYLVNLGSHDVSVFSINSGTGLLTYETTDSVVDGTPIDATAISVNPAGTVLYVGGSINTGAAADHLDSYAIGTNGALTHLASAAGPVDIDGMTISSSGTELAVAFPGTSATYQPQVALFKTSPTTTGTDTMGELDPIQGLPQTCPTDVRFSPSGSTLYSVACAQGALLAYTSSTTALSENSTAPVTPVDSQTLAVGSDGTIYTETTVSGATVIAAYKYTAASGFTLEADAPYPASQTISSIAISPDGTQLYAAGFLTSNQTTVIDPYSIGSSGSGLSLTPEGVLSNYSGYSTGLASVVALTSTCPGVNSVCTDTQNFSVTVLPGALTISTPYTATNPFVLPALTLSADGTYLSSSATFPSSTNPSNQQIVVTSTLAGDPGWSLSVSATNLTNGAGGTIPSSGLGLTNGSLIGTGTFPGAVTFTNLPAHNPSPADPDTNTGLAAGSSYTFATTPAGDGTAVMDGTLTLLAPSSTPPGGYTGAISFSVS